MAKSKRIVKWTGIAQKRMFELLPRSRCGNKVVGFYSPDWTSKPPHMTCKEYIHAVERVLRKLQKEGHLLDTSVASVCLRIQFAVQPCSQGYFKTVHNEVRLIAYSTGFMDMSDIVELERRSIEKYGRQRAAQLTLILDSKDDTDHDTDIQRTEGMDEFEGSLGEAA